jgi:uncharacterized protein YcfJ
MWRFAMNKQLLSGVAIGVAVAGVIGALASLRSNDADAGKAALAQPLAAVSADGASGGSALPESAAVESDTVAANSTANSSTGAAVSSGSAGAGGERFAVVLASTPVTVSDKVAREDCKDVAVTKQKPIKDEDKIAGTAIGAVVGGVLGNQIGDGDGQKIATVAGAVVGGYAGRKVQGRIQDKATETVNERQCQTVYDTTERNDGYKVKYELDGTVRTVRMKTDPGVGTRIPASDKRLDNG